MFAPDAPRANSDGYQALIRRCAACHENALEGFGPFAAAVLCAKLFIGRKDRKAAALAARLAIQ